MKIEDLTVGRSVAYKLLKKHGVTIPEVFEVFWSQYHKVMIRRSLTGAGRYLAFGRTEAGRYLVVAFSIKKQVAHILTARDMSERERRLS